MSGEPDSGTGPGGSGVKLEPPINNNNNEDTECDKVSASNANFESKDGLKIMQCERCGEFETISLALLLVHSAQCNPSNRGEAENHNDTNSNDQPPPSEATKQSRKLFEVRLLDELELFENEISFFEIVRRVQYEIFERSEYAET